MSQANVPHFDYPFRFDFNNHAACVEQDSIEDIENCIVSILLTEIGARIEIPEYGMESMLFKQQPLSSGDIYNAITSQESRAHMVVSTDPDMVDYLTALVDINVQADQAVGGIT